MASMTFSNALLPLAGTDRVVTAENTTPGFFARFMDAMIESRRRTAEREIARLEIVYGFKLRDVGNHSDKPDTAELPFAR